MEFNLTAEPWVPCMTAEPRLLNLLDTLINAHEIERVWDPSPLVTISLYRFLLAIVHRVFGPSTDQEWKNLWDRGRFDDEALREYFKAWSHRFDLFDSHRPFYQDPSIKGYLEKGKTSPSTLKQELSRGALLFDHAHGDTRPDMYPAEAARLLLTCNNFDLDPRGAGGLYMKLGLLIDGVVFMNIGNSLFETLLVNSVRYDPERGVPENTKPSDAPAWERDIAPAAERLPDGYLDWLTWQSRKMLLNAKEKNGRICIGSVIKTRGDSVPDSFTDGNPAYYYDKMFAFRLNSRPKESQKPWQALRVSAGRALWRDFYSLFESSGVETSRRPPGVVTRINELIEDGIFDGEYIPVAAYSMNRGPQAAKVNFWREEYFSLPLEYLRNDELAYELQKALSAVEAIGRSLNSALAGLIGEADSGYYWSEVEGTFKEYVFDLAHKKAALETFLEDVKRLALDNFFQSGQMAGTSGKFLRTATEQEVKLRGRIKKVITSTLEEEDE